MDRRYEAFLIGVDNPLDLVYAQDEKILKEDISATFENYQTKEKTKLEVFEDRGYFYIRPHDLGRVTIKVKTKDGLKEKIVNTKLITAVGKLSRYRANHSAKLEKGEFRAQQGIFPAIEGYDIDARCTIIQYEMIRINAKNKVARTINQGGKFESKTRKLITRADSKDVFIFRNILYKCPGDHYERRLGDMIFEIE